MEVWLLGVGALVLIALTVWIVWPTSAAPAADAAPADEFDDRYTSATADLSAGGVAVAAQEESAGVVPPAATILAEPIRGAEPAGGSPVQPPRQSSSPPRAVPAQPLLVGGPPPLHEMTQPRPRSGRTLYGVAAAALFTSLGAVGGAWLYARWRKEHTKPVRRLRRRFF